MQDSLEPRPPGLFRTVESLKTSLCLEAPSTRTAAGRLWRLRYVVYGESSIPSSYLSS